MTKLGSLLVLLNWVAVYSIDQRCQTSGVCTSLVQCAPFYDWALESCALPDNTNGVCCPQVAGPNDSQKTSAIIGLRKPSEDPLAAYSADDLNEAADQGIQKADHLAQLEQHLLSKGLTVRRGSTAHLHALMLRSGSQVKNKVLDGQRVLQASKELQKRLGLSAAKTAASLPTISLKATALKSSCSPIITCPETKYRPVDGSCNNLENPSWGQQWTTFQRIVPPKYGDGIYSPRLSSNGNPLPSARQVSTVVVKNGPGNQDNYTLVFMSWGQFITHDMSLSAAFTYEDGTSPVCCAESGGHLNPDDMHPSCLPIDIPESDAFYSQYNQTCMSFVRTLVGAREDCTFGYAEQLNGITHWLDGSQVYGSNVEESMNLRQGSDGLMKTTVEDGQHLLPTNPPCDTKICYVAGDTRAMENPQLTVLHTLMLREHNRVATALKELNPTWDDEILFQEARRIVIAQLQHITYNEYLPLMLGATYMQEHDLVPLTSGHYTGYSHSINPSIINDFTTAAYRVGHSQVQSSLRLYFPNDTEDTDKTFTLRNYFFDASELHSPDWLDSALRGFTKQVPRRIDTLYAVDLQRWLFQGDKPYGADLVALNVQRGREHGIADYNTYRQYCGLPKATTFDDLASEMDAPNIEALRNVYASVDDIDLYIAGLSERPFGDSSVGPTILCILGEQFVRMKQGDRFFYENGGQNSSFTLDQLNEIRKSSLARILCDNNNGTVTLMQPLAFRSPTDSNERVSCSSIPSVNLSKWKANMATESSTSSSTGTTDGATAVTSLNVSIMLTVSLAAVIMS